MTLKMILKRLGIKKLPKSSKGGVYLAYRYYYKLFLKIKSMPSHLILKERIRIPNFRKLIIMIKSISRHQLEII